MRKLIISLLFILAVAVLMYASLGRSGESVRSTVINEGGQETPKRAILSVLHAGSLTAPLEEIVKAYERGNPNVEVRLEASGSVEAIRKVTELGKKADIVISADHHLIRSMMFPEYADWYVIFATNQLVLAYTDRSKYASEVNESNWYYILMREDVRLGFSDPNRDPCGYRAVMALLLASELYGAPLNSLLVEGTNLRVEGTEAWVPDPVKGSGKVLMRPKSVELLSLLDLGVLDYAFEYKSVAIQHNFRYVELPPEISFSSPELSSLYSQAAVHLYAGREDEQVIRGDVIAYALTIPRSSEDKNVAIDFLKFLLTEGLKMFEEQNQQPLRPPIGVGNVPVELRSLVEVRG
ncbi:MAG: tungstate ABC transporter substrate-binding protein WtpA [Candidatus Korarchaeum sp.]|nr:tungstate ABC transporter substrate-binding protein WtpA [Candidatus Korarchaeum sp.]MDW8035646.1 tungstate ABC transporter substrate-binding protein WtpA [Candidatus Korarchaeum sp.]